MKNALSALVIVAACGVFAFCDSDSRLQISYGSPTIKQPSPVAAPVAKPVETPAPSNPSPDCTCTDCQCVGCVCQPIQQPKEPAATLPASPVASKKQAAGKWVLRTYTSYGRFGRARGTYQQWVLQGPQQTYQQPTTYYYRSSCGSGGCR